MSKMVRRIALLILVLLPVFACGETPTPGHVSPTLVAPPWGDTCGETPTPGYVSPTLVSPPRVVEAVTLNAGEAARVTCLAGPVSIRDYGDQVIICCLKR